MDAQRYYAPAALAAAVAAWRVGNDVQQAVRDAGYAVEVAQGLSEYVSSRFYTDPMGDVSTPAKRARTEYTTPSTRRERTPKVAPGVKKYVKRCMDRLVEKKYGTKVVGSVVAGTTGTVSSLGMESIVQGTTDSTRVGNLIRLSYIRITGSVNDTTAAAPYPQGWIRWAVVYDKQTNGATPAVGDILNTPSVYSNWNHDNVVGAGGGRFEVLKYGTVHYTCNAGNTSAANNAIPLAINIKLKGKLVRFDASTGGITDLVSGGLFLLTIGQNATLQTYCLADFGYTDA